MTSREIRLSTRNMMRGSWGICVPIWITYFVLIWLINWLVGIVFSKFGIRPDFPSTSGGFDEFLFKLVSNITMLISMLIIGGPLLYGIIRVFLRIYSKEKIYYGQMFEGFRDWKRTFLAYFLMTLYTCLWSVLLIIPGIIASLSYSMAFFILAENPGISSSGAIKLSKQMMKGHKAELFKLFLSFIGWFILCIFSLGIGFLWLSSYIKASYVIFYKQISKNHFEGLDLETTFPLPTKTPKKKTILLIIGAIVLLSIILVLTHPYKRTTNNTILGQNVIGSEFTPTEFMTCFFGNYLPGIDVSALNPKSVSEIGSSEWVMAEGQAQQLGGWNELDQIKRDEFLSLTGKVPYKFLKQWELPDNSYLVAFEAGNWQFTCDSWGGAGFEMSHDMGVTYYMKDETGWHCGSYALNLGKFGAYCTTNLSEKLIKIADEGYAIQTLSYNSYIIGLENSKPKVLLEIPFYGGIGHGDPEQFSSVITTIPSASIRYDIIVKSSGKNDETNEVIKYFRRYTFNQGTYKYDLTEHSGNIKSIESSISEKVY